MAFDELPDPVQSAILRLIDKTGRRAAVTYSELDTALSGGEISADQLEAILSFLMEHGINVVE